MKLTVDVALQICLVVFSNDHQISSQPIETRKPIDLKFYKQRVQARQNYVSEDEYYDEDEEEKPENDSQLPLSKQNYDEGLKIQVGYLGDEEPEEEDVNEYYEDDKAEVGYEEEEDDRVEEDGEEEEGKEDDEDDYEVRFVKNNGFLRAIFDIL